MFCRKCGAEISDDSTYCLRCGEKVTSLSENNEHENSIGRDAFNSEVKEHNNLDPMFTTNQKNNYNDYINDLKNKFEQITKRKGPKGCMIAIIAFVALLFLIGIFADVEEDEGSETSSTTSVQVDSNVVTTEPLDSSVSLLVDEGLTVDEAESIMDDLESVGIDDLTSLTRGAGTGVDELQSYAFSGSTCSGTLTIEKRNTYYIGSGSIDLFDSDKGGALDNVKYYVLDHEISYQHAAKDYVKQILKSPSTAEFPGMVFSASDWSTTRYKDVVTVKSYVDSQNSFGAMIRSDFAVQMSYESKSLICIVFDGEVVYGELVKK